MAKGEFKSNAQAVQALFMQRATEGMLAAQQEYANDMTETLSQEPHGRYYLHAGTSHWRKVDGPGPGVHRASAPGEPPAVLSGFLRDSIRSETVSADRTSYKGAVSTEAPYAALLEFGGVNGEGHDVEPRPAWFSTLMFGKGKYIQAVRNAANR